MVAGVDSSTNPCWLLAQLSSTACATHLGQGCPTTSRHKTLREPENRIWEVKTEYRKDAVLTVGAVVGQRVTLMGDGGLTEANPTPRLNAAKIAWSSHEYFSHGSNAGGRSPFPPQQQIFRSLAYLGESGRDPEFSRSYGRMWKKARLTRYIYGLPSVSHLRLLHPPHPRADATGCRDRVEVKTPPGDGIVR